MKEKAKLKRRGERSKEDMKISSRRAGKKTWLAIRAAEVLVLAAAASALVSCTRTPRLVRFHDPLSPEEHARLGAIYEREGKLERAAHEYVSALGKDPDNTVLKEYLHSLENDSPAK